MASVRSTTEVRRGRPPVLMEREGGDVQPLSSGVGVVHERTYQTRIEGTGLSPEEALRRIEANLNAAVPLEVAEFVRSGPVENSLEPGDEWVIRMPGPWNARVRCVERSQRSFRFVTLDGHMEAGEIEFRTTRPSGENGADGAILFEIRSIARSGDRPFKLLYEGLQLGARMQTHMWVHLCRRLSALLEGRRNGPVEVRTIRYEG